MSAKENVITDALKLPVPERLEVAERLYESLEGPADADAEQAWAAEIERRVKEADAGRGRFLSWEEARRAIRGDGDGGTAT